MFTLSNQVWLSPRHPKLWLDDDGWCGRGINLMTWVINEQSNWDLTGWEKQNCVFVGILCCMSSMRFVSKIQSLAVKYLEQGADIYFVNYIPFAMCGCVCSYVSNLMCNIYAVVFLKYIHWMHCSTALKKIRICFWIEVQGAIYYQNNTILYMW